ncbi:hypothetical protein, partial [Brevundimonas sp.]|uniref:hypothetical protein n=1 Tax=Brevundimonas sp. TaxID=1871086 RepID=UPI0025BEBDF0
MRITALIAASAAALIIAGCQKAPEEKAQEAASDAVEAAGTAADAALTADQAAAEAAAAKLRAELSQLKARQAELAPLAESILQEQVSAVVN